MSPVDLRGSSPLFDHDAKGVARSYRAEPRALSSSTSDPHENPPRDLSRNSGVTGCSVVAHCAEFARVDFAQGIGKGEPVAVLLEDQRPIGAPIDRIVLIEVQH